VSARKRRKLPPKYERIADDIEAQIASGDLKPGDQLPTTKEIQEQYGAGYGTVRSAILILKSKKLIEGRQGEGMYVRTPESS
jgi:GntR family transcriptional regulator